MLDTSPMTTPDQDFALSMLRESFSSTLVGATMVGDVLIVSVNRDNKHDVLSIDQIGIVRNADGDALDVTEF